MKTKPKPRARRMWANYYRDTSVLHETRRMAALCIAPGAMHKVIPVAVIPLDDPEALVLKASLAVDDEIICGSVNAIARAALTAIGVLSKRRKGGRK